MEAIILAGGLGTRLRSVVQNIPKGMAPIQGRPFLAYQLDYLIEQGVNRIIFSVGYLHECISNYFGREYNGCQIVYSVEESPLGTGGAIRQALHHCKDQNIWVLNGDTYCNVNLKDMLVFHRTHHADVSI